MTAEVGRNYMKASMKVNKVCNVEVYLLVPHADSLKNDIADGNAVDPAVPEEGHPNDLEYAAPVPDDDNEEDDPDAEGEDEEYHEIADGEAHTLEEENEYENAATAADTFEAGEEGGVVEPALDADEVHQHDETVPAGTEHTEYEEYTEYNEDYDERYGGDVPEEGGEAAGEDGHGDWEGEYDGEKAAYEAAADESLPTHTPAANEGNNAEEG